MSTLLALALFATAAERPLYYDRPIVAADLEGRSLRELTLLRNWIFARAGNKFRKQWLNDFFTKQDWYKPTGLNEKKLSDSDRKNADAIARYELALPREKLKTQLDLLLEKSRYADSGNEAFAFSTDGKFALSGGNNAVTVWQIPSGAPLRTLKLPDKGRLRALALDADGIVTAAWESSPLIRLTVWGSNGDILRTTSTDVTDDGTVGVFDLSLDGKIFVDGMNLTAWDSRSGKRGRSLLSKEFMVPALTLDGTRVLSGNDKGELILWRLSDGAQIWKHAGFPKTSQWKFSMSQDGATALADADEGKAMRIDLKSGKTLSRTEAVVDGPRSPDARYGLVAKERSLRLVVTRTRAASLSSVQSQAKATLPSPHAITAEPRRSIGPMACVPCDTTTLAPAASATSTACRNSGYGR